MTGITDGCYLAEYVGKLERENAKLRHDLEEANNQAEEVCIENAKLRELVRDMAAEIRGLGVDFKRVGWCEYADRMRELGVEL